MINSIQTWVNVQRVRLGIRRFQIEPYLALKVDPWRDLINQCVRLDRVIIQLGDDGDLTRIVHDIEQELRLGRPEMIFRIEKRLV